MSAVLDPLLSLPEARRREPRPRDTEATELKSLNWQLWTSAGVALALVIAVGIAVSIGYQRFVSVPVTHVRFLGDAEHLDRGELKRFASQVSGGIGKVNIHDLRNQAKRMPWVREASVRRKFPHTLEVSLEAHRPLARWGDGQSGHAHLINTHGERFAATVELDLPRFVGPDGREREMAMALARFQTILMPAGHTLTEVRLSTRGAWQVVLATGAVIDLGRADAESRLSRFVTVTRDMPELTRAPHIDLRHARGFAVRHAAPPAASAPAATTSSTSSRH